MQRPLLVVGISGSPQICKQSCHVYVLLQKANAEREPKRASGAEPLAGSTGGWSGGAKAPLN